jgi:hypothetical protein
MPASPTTTTVLPVGAGAPKLRSSCDSCGIAKVKCDRKQPECDRCKALDQACVYGLSRHSGKPPRKRVATDLEVAGRCKRRAATIEAGHSHHTTLGCVQPQDWSQSGPPKSSSLGIDTPPFAPSLTSTLWMDERNEFSSAFFTPFLNEWPQLDIFEVGLENPPAPTISATNRRLSVPAMEPASSLRINSTSRKTHSCPRESYEIFRDLICPSPYLHAPEADSDPVSAQLDQVLGFTRNAIDRLTQLLRCPCARSGHRVMVHASIISRILLWYQQAADWACNRAWQPKKLALVDSPMPSSVYRSPPRQDDAAVVPDSKNNPTLAQCTGFVVEHVPVTVGTFSIEDHNVQASFRDQLILCELKKTSSLIDAFTSQDSCECSANGLQAHLGAWLRNEQSRIVRVLTTRLTALRESINLD